MTEPDPSAGDLRIPLERPIAIRFEYFKDFINELSSNISVSGMFVKTANPRPPGSVIDFEFRLGDDFTLIAGRAEVVWNRRRNQGPERPPGMGVRYLELDPTSHKVIEEMVSQHEQKGGKTFDVEADADGTGSDQASTKGARADSEAAASPAAIPEAASGTDSAALLEALTRTRTELSRLRKISQASETILQGKMEKAVASVADVKQRLKEARQTTAEGEKERQELVRRLEETTRDTSKSERTIDELRTAIDAANADLEKARAEAATAADLRTELDTARDQVETLGQQLQSEASAKEQLADLEGRLSSAQAARAQSDKSHKDLEREMESTRSRIEALEKDEATLRSDLEAASSSAESAIESLETANSERADLEEQIGTAMAARTTLEGDLAEAVRARDAQVDELGLTKERLLEAEKANRARIELEAELKEAREAEGAARDAQSAGNKEREAAEARLEELQAEHEDQLEQASKLQRQLEEGQETLSQQRERVTSLEKSLATAEGALHESREQLESLGGLLSETESARDGATAQLESTSLEKSALETRLAELQSALDSSDSERSDVSEALREAQEEAEDRRGRIEALTGANAALEANLEAARQEAATLADQARAAQVQLRSELDELSRTQALGEGDVQAVRDSVDARDAEFTVALERVTDATQPMPVADPTEAGLELPLPSARKRRSGGLGLALAALLLMALGAALWQWMPWNARSETEGTAAAAGVRASAEDPDVADDEGTDHGGTSPSELPSEPASGTSSATAEPPPQPMPVQIAPRRDPATIQTAVDAWARAWSAQDVDAYLASYANSFQPPDGLSRAAWAVQRRNRILRPASLQITVGQLQGELLDDEHARATFVQGYQSPTYGDEVTKRLELVWEDGRWKITAEAAQ